MSLWMVGLKTLGKTNVRMKMLIKCYLVFLHLLVVIVLSKSNFLEKVSLKLGFPPKSQEITPYYRDLVGFHSRIDRQIPANSVIFIGDSHIQGLAVSAITANGVNYGIGNDTSEGVLKRLGHYSSIAKASAVVLAIGYNDLRYRSNEEILNNMTNILHYLSRRTQVLLSAVMPVKSGSKKLAPYNHRIFDLNQRLESLADDYPRVSFVSINQQLEQEGALVSHLFLDDGVHLSPAGYKLWIKRLRAELRKMRPSL